VIPELYPEASRHLMAAFEAKAALSTTWARYLDDGLIDIVIVTQPDGAGRIAVVAYWPVGARAALTSLFATCTSELRASLDSLVTESVDLFSILKRPRAPQQRRLFPLSDSEDHFKSLLTQSCMDGVLDTQFQVVLGSQPFSKSPDHDTAKRVRVALRHLLEWSAALADGHQLGAWVTPVSPEIEAEPPTEIHHFSILEPGTLDTERDVASFDLANYSGQGGISGTAGSYVDLAFRHWKEPTGIEETLSRQVDLAIDAVARLGDIFASLAEAAPASKRVIARPDQANSVAWLEAAQSSRRWGADDLAKLKNSETGIGVVVDTSELTLLVATGDEVYERTVPDASPLNAHIQRGVAAEGAVRDAAATWGLPDFVLRPHVERKGRGVREISDGLLLAGDHGLIIEVKSRDTTPGSPSREVAWLAKKIAEGARQAGGTLRRLSSDTVNMVNGRGRDISINGAEVRWVGVVIIDHPAPPADYRIPDLSCSFPIVVLLRRDWEFLFDQLRSTHAVISYLERVGNSAPVLGEEPARYYELAAADAGAKPAYLDISHFPSGVLISAPTLPWAPAGSDGDEAHGMVRIMCEDIALTNFDRPETDRLQVLAAIDSLPIGHRTDLGKFLLDGLNHARQVDPETAFWKLRTFRTSVAATQLGFGVCSKFSELARQAFISWVRLRHYERGDLDTLADSVSIGVLLTPRHDGLRDWDTTMIAVFGDPELDEEELQLYRNLWNEDRSDVS
jgi:hypothetical protein